MEMVRSCDEDSIIRVRPKVGFLRIYLDYGGERKIRVYEEEQRIYFYGITREEFEFNLEDVIYTDSADNILNWDLLLGISNVI